MRWARILDCGDISSSRQFKSAFWELSHRQAATNGQVRKPKLISIGGDESSTFQALRALEDVYRQRIALVRFGGDRGFLHNGLKGVIESNSSVHIGNYIRSRSKTLHDGLESSLGIFGDEIDDLQPTGVASAIDDRVGSLPVYLSINLNIIDVGLAPGVSDPIAGGWSTRELISVLRGIEGLNIVGAEVVGVAPVYDGEGGQTALMAAQIVYEILSSIVKRDR
jgi:agmatinase